MEARNVNGQIKKLQCLEKEIWKPIKNYEGVYEVSNKGKIRSLERKVNYKNKKERTIEGQEKMQTLNSKGYLKVTLWNKHKSQTREVQRIVAETFIPNTENKSQVNHINGIKTDNRVDNLEWCTPKENTQHSIYVLKNGLVGVCKFDKKSGKCLEMYESIKEAGIKNGIKPCSISNVVNGRRKTAGGYEWAIV